MNARRTRWGGRLLAAALLCAGCSTPYSAARDNADAALQRGDLPQAARYEMEACRLEPSSDACVRAEGLRADVEAKALRRASELLDADDPEGALGALRPARELQETPALRARVEQLAGHAAARCAVAPEGTPAQIVARLRCFDALRSLVALPEYDAKVAQEREHAAADLDERARLAQSSRLGGAALAYGALAQCASGTPERSERTARLAAQLAETDAVAVNPLGPDAASACARLEQSFHGRVVCAPATDALPLRVTLVAEHVRHSVAMRGELPMHDRRPERRHGDGHSVRRRPRKDILRPRGRRREHDARYQKHPPSGHGQSRGHVVGSRRRSFQRSLKDPTPTSRRR